MSRCECIYIYIYIYACGTPGSQHRNGICGVSMPAAAMVDTGEFQGGAMMYSLHSSLDIFEGCNLREDPGGNNVMIVTVLRYGDHPIMVPLFTFQTSMSLMEVTNRIYSKYPESPLGVIPAMPGERWQMHGHRLVGTAGGGQRVVGKADDDKACGKAGDKA